MCLVKFLAKVRFKLGCEQFEYKGEETENHNSGSERQKDDDVTDGFIMNGDESASPNE